ncbi:hypothetical protein OLM02_00655 [Enterococcus faecalis]|uniref:hypothetical protein n=1 Tax=Enterococcus faecalis TaxID=1351 RepID=UPI0019251067|nr:hypothetical protein [Enterococcus faecalis]MDV5011269.1 hypothetical protein [Enterococcus faecium]UYY44524.1 hypothetical protein OLM02_00655 [Enterococcus faecalis]HCR3189323.1 hypothetical protein [Enterococcus faecalis]
MKNIIYIPLSLLRLLSKKTLAISVENYGNQCGFLNHIERISKAHKQTNESVYVLFSLLQYLFERFSIIYATNPSFLSGLSVKGDRDTSSLPFTTRKGVRSYEAIYFPNHN